MEKRLLTLVFLGAAALPLFGQLVGTYFLIQNSRGIFRKSLFINRP